MPGQLKWSDLGETFDGPHATPKRVTKGPYFLNISSLSHGRLDLSQSDHIGSEEYARWTKRVTPQENDLLFSYETRLGEAALMPDGISACLGRRMALLRPNQNVVNPRFLLYYYLSPAFQRLIEQNTVHGATVPRISLKTIGQWPVEIPPLKTQVAIADILGALDDKIAANTKLANRSDELAFLKYAAAVASTDVVPMSQKLTPILGGTPSRSRNDYWDGNERWISAKDVTGAFGQLILDTEEKITTLAAENTKAKPLPKGSVIMTARGTVGAVARLGEPSSFNQSCYGFIPGDVPASILYFAVRSAADHAKSMAHGSVFDTITKKTFDHLVMPELAYDDANNLDAVLSPLLSVVESSARENLKISEIRDALLPQLMSGKLRVKDAESVIGGAI